MTLSLRHIEIFHAVMVSGGATQAAESLRTSQPTVSRELKEFEASLGFPLFVRKGRRLLPTEAALALHAEVRRSFIGIEEIARAAEAIRANASSHINIACLPAYSTTLLPALCRDVLRDHGSIRLSIHSFEQPVIAAGLAAQQYDFAIIEADASLEELEEDRITMGEELCILPAGHPLTRKSILTPKDFEGVDFIYFSAEDSYRRKIDSVFQAHGVTRRLRVEATAATAVCALVAQGLGVSIVNPISALHCPQGTIEMRRFSVSIPYTVGLYRAARGGRSRLLDSFTDFCGASLRRIAEEFDRIP